MACTRTGGLTTEPREPITRRLAALAIFLTSACDLGAAPPDGTGTTAQAATADPGTTHVIHVNGACSQSYTAELGEWDGVVSINAHVDQRSSMATATADLEGVLNEYCLGNDWCYVLTFSNGGAVVSKLFAESDTAWNIAYVMSSASNEGGSELGEFGFLSKYIGCDIATAIRPSANRSWNHNDTNGNAIYMIGGHDGRFATSWALPGEDDGTVAYHSAAGASSIGSYTDLCEPARWANHFITGACEGYDLDHGKMKRKHICLLGGGGSPCY